MLKLKKQLGIRAEYEAAAFGRLCVETANSFFLTFCCCLQPPSGGCVLKHFKDVALGGELVQPPSGGCVFKLFLRGMYGR